MKAALVGEPARLQGLKTMHSTHTTVAPARLRRADPRFYGIPTEQLLLDLSWIRQCRMDTTDDPELEESTRRNSLDYLDHRAAPIVQELKRRHAQHERHKSDPNRGPWPTAKRYEDTLRLAHALRSTVPVAAYIAAVLPDVALKKSGTRFKGRCPFHEDNDPSFLVFEDQHWHCFSCHRSGDLFDIAGVVEGMESFADQVRHLSAFSGTEMPS